MKTGLQTDPPPDATADGRVLRRERNRAAIVDALYELTAEGVLRPTAEAVAERARVKPRTVFRHFDSMPDLYQELSARVREQVAPLLVIPTGHGTLAERVHQLVESRGRAYPIIAPFRRAMRVNRWLHDFLRKQNDDSARELRAQLVGVLPELRGAPATLLAGVELLTSFEAWERLRVDQGLGKERAASAIEQAALALLESL